MATKGKWAQGIEPRHFHWIIAERLAVCERPGGFGPNHRKVRRMEEIIWVREQGFDFIVSMSPAPHNLHNYGELGVAWRHWPFPSAEELPRYLAAVYGEMGRLISSKRKIVCHMEELGDRLLGLMAGYLVFARLVPEPPKAIQLIEHMLAREIGPLGREVVAVAATLDPDAVTEAPVSTPAPEAELADADGVEG